MNKSHLPLAIILSVLITVILIASVALVILLSASPQPDAPADSTTTAPSADVTTTQIPDGSTTTTTTPPATTPNTPDPKPPATDPIDPTPNPGGTTVPTPTPSPGLSPVSGRVTGDSVGSLGIFAEYVTEEVDPDQGTMQIRFTFYLQSYSLRVGARSDNYLVVNGKEYKNLATEKIDLPSGSPQTRTELYEYVVEIEKTDENTPVLLEIEYFWHFQGSYSGERADWLSVKAELSI